MAKREREMLASSRSFSGWVVFLKSDVVIVTANAVSLAFLLGILYFKRSS